MNDEFTTEKEAFTNYLQQKKYMPKTVTGYVQDMVTFLKWAAANRLDEMENVQYRDLLNYVQYEQQRKKDVSTINQRLTSIKKYFNFLRATEIVSHNPASTLRIKGKARTVTEQPLSYEELEKMYHEYKKLDHSQASENSKEKMELAHERSIIITGLLIWQGLQSGELERLEVNHININEGTIYIPSTTRSNSRTLQLSAQQILTLHTYIHGGTREKLLEATYSKRNGEDYLIPGNVYAHVKYTTQSLKGINPQIKNVHHIRASVILYWLKQYNKRQVQYMAGHRYIDSTERYALQEMDTLTDQLTRHHPFG